MADPLPAATVTRIEQLAREGKSLNAIAREVGCSRSSVARYAPPGSFDRTATAAAVKAHKIDAAARRAQLADETLTKAAVILDRITNPHLTFGWYGKDGDYQEKELPEPPAADVRALASAASTLLAAHLRLVDHDNTGDDQDGADAIMSFGQELRADYERRHGS